MKRSSRCEGEKNHSCVYVYADDDDTFKGVLSFIRNISINQPSPLSLTHSQADYEYENDNYGAEEMAKR